MNSIFVIAHAPLAQALRQCALHVFPDAESGIAALDVQARAAPEESLASARILLAQQIGRSPHAQVLVLTDVFGATPSRIAMGLAEPFRVIVIAGVNLPMLLKALGNRRCPLEDLAAMLIDSAKNGIVEVRQAQPEAPGKTSGESDAAA